LSLFLLTRAGGALLKSYWWSLLLEVEDGWLDLMGGVGFVCGGWWFGCG